MLQATNKPALPLLALQHLAPLFLLAPLSQDLHVLSSNPSCHTSRFLPSLLSFLSSPAISFPIMLSCHVVSFFFYSITVHTLPPVPPSPFLPCPHLSCALLFCLNFLTSDPLNYVDVIFGAAHCLCKRKIRRGRTWFSFSSVSSAHSLVTSSLSAYHHPSSDSPLLTTSYRRLSLTLFLLCLSSGTSFPLPPSRNIHPPFALSLSV